MTIWTVIPFQALVSHVTKLPDDVITPVIPPPLPSPAFELPMIHRPQHSNDLQTPTTPTGPVSSVEAKYCLAVTMHCSMLCEWFSFDFVLCFTTAGVPAFGYNQYIIIIIVLNHPLPLWSFSGIMNKYFKWNIVRLTIPTSRRQTSWLFTRVAEDVNSELTRTNPASSQGVTWYWGLQTTRPVL